MVTKNRLDLLPRAVACFQRQSYPHRELIVVNDADDGTKEFIASLADERIVYVRPERLGLPLGELRNFAVDHAKGVYVAQWDDDDWHHTDRIAIQLMTLEQARADLCLLERWTLAWPERNQFSFSKRRPWEGTMLARKERLPKYAALRLGEDSVLVDECRAMGLKLHLLDRPDLYVYVVHGRNSYPLDHFTRNIFNDHTGDLSLGEVTETLKRLQLNPGEVTETAGLAGTPDLPPRPSVCVLIPVYNQAKFLFRAISSAYWQLEPQDELVVVDDASTDLEDQTALQPFIHRILWLRNPSRRGVSFSRNHGIIKSRADWIKPLDADDILAPFALNAIRNTRFPAQTVLVTGGCHRIRNEHYLDYLCATNETIQSTLHQSPTLPSAAFIRRQALLDVGLFDTRIDFEEDWDMWLKLYKHFGENSFSIVNQPFCYYWIEESERSQKKRHGTVDGVPVREYFRMRYGADPR